MTQTTFFDSNYEIPAHQRHSDTSRAAALSVAHKFPALQIKMLNVLKQGALTDEELCTAMNMEGNSERPCRVSLVKKGYVVDTGERRIVRSGRKAVVWGVAPNLPSEI
jgi:hypothetical protein